MSLANETQVGGKHYKGVAIQHWDMVAANGLGYFEGQVSKYVTRWRKKNGLEDLNKAKHFLQKLIEVVAAHGVETHVHSVANNVCLLAWPRVDMYAYAETNGLTANEGMVCELMDTWYEDASRLQFAMDLIDGLIQEAQGMEVIPVQRRLVTDPATGAEPGRGYVNQG